MVRSNGMVRVSIIEASMPKLGDNRRITNPINLAAKPSIATTKKTPWNTLWRVDKVHATSSGLRKRLCITSKRVASHETGLEAPKAARRRDRRERRNPSAGGSAGALAGGGGSDRSLLLGQGRTELSVISTTSHILQTLFINPFNTKN